MKYLKHLQPIDILIFLTFFPFWFVLPFLVKVFAIVGIYLVYKKSTALLAFLGAFSIMLSFYNFWELRDFRVYILFLVSMLLWGVYLQRTKEENFYLRLSPVLFFLMSVVFFQNIYMAFYVVFEVFVFVVVVLTGYMDLKKALKKAGVIFAFSFPIGVVLFLVFPRIHQTHFVFGFEDKNVYSGFSKNVDTSLKDVKLNSFLVAEFKLSKDYKRVYLRGNVLNEFKNGIWYEGKSVKDKLIKISELEVYYLKQTPTNDKYIFAVDLPIESDYGKINKNFVLVSKSVIKRPLFIQITSAINPIYGPVVYPYNDLAYDKSKNLKIQKLIKNIKLKSDKEKLKEIIKLFKSQKLKYSLKANLDSLNIVDTLFEKKRGYCVHFASAFAILARMVGLPSRIVNGFVAKKSINGYYKVYSKDAHTWVEVLVDNRWIRVDPTLFTYNHKSTKKQKSFSVSEYLSYVKFLLEEWILRYDVTKQKRFFAFFKINFIYFFGLVVVVLGVFLLFRGFKKKSLLEPLFKKIGRPHKESIYSFLKSFNNEKLDEINELYHKITYYKATKEDIKKLKKLIKEFKWT
ncbi:MAG: DUF3488 and transglutaminase-like domain-containing protein [Nautiliaceae bacterium]